MNKLKDTNFKELFKNKKTKNVIIVTIIFLIFIFVSATYAYFTAQVKGGTGANINAQTGTTDSLMFDASDIETITADNETFAQGKGNITKINTATATLIPNNNTNYAKDKYNVFLIIKGENNFVYTKDEDTPELVVKVIDPNNVEKETISGLKNIGNNLFDITTRHGAFLVASDYEIEANGSSYTDTWKVEITLNNLDHDQRDNRGKTLDCELYLTKEKISNYEVPVVNNLNIENKTSSSIKVKADVSSTEKIDKYYFAIKKDSSMLSYNPQKNYIEKIVNIPDGVKFIENDSDTYEFTDLDYNTEYILYSYVVDVNGMESNIYETSNSIKTNKYVNPSIINVVTTSTLESITANVIVSKGENEIANYYYSINDGEYVESLSDSYTFNDLTDTTSYKIKVKVKDTHDEYSTEFTKNNVETEKYINPVITKVDKKTTYNSFDLTVSASAGHGEVNGTYPIVEYLYQVNDGTWNSITSNVISLNDLDENESYKINIKVKDSYGKESSVYETTVITDAYEIPSVTATVPSSDITSTSFKVNAKATNGDGTIKTYMYSKDGGSNWVSVGSTELTNSYTFEDLTSGALFQVSVKVIDSNNRESDIVSIPNISTLNVFINNSINYVGGYNENPQKFTPSISPNATSIYYSTSIKLDVNNYKTSGTTTQPTRTDLGTTTVYWCAEKEGYETICGENTITINKGTPTFTVASTASISSTAKTSSITVDRSGDGSLSCESASTGNATGNKASCSVSGTTITFTRNGTNTGSESFTIKLAEGTKYNAGANKTVTLTVNNQNFTNSSSNYSGTYDGNSKTFTVSLKDLSGTEITDSTMYYSTSTKLTPSNYSSGDTTKPTRTNAGTDTVYWCAVKSGFNTYCGENTITINKATPTFSLSSTTSAIGSTANASSITVTRSGDGAISCESVSTGTSTGSNAICSVSGNTVTFTRNGTNTGSENFTIKLAAGTNYNAGSNKTVALTVNNQNFTNSSSNITGTYNGNAKTITISLKDVTGTTVTPTTMYYSTSTKLDTSNYTSSGSTTKPTRTDVGTTTVYWCAVKSGFNTLCSSNTITINKATPTFSLSSTSSTISATANTSSITVTRSGDGSLSCESASTGTTTGTYAKCSVSGTTVTFTRVAAGTENFTIKLAAGTNYNAGSDKTVSVTVNKLNFTNNSSNVTGTYNGSDYTFTPSLSPSATSIYYSTSTELTTSNYTSSGSTSGTHSRTNAGTTTVYWCAIKAGYNTLCSSNTITISKATPSLSTTSVALSTNNSASVTYTGDGTPSCGKTSGIYVNCSVSGKTITFTRKSSSSYGSEEISVSATAGSNYSALTSTNITINILLLDAPMSCTSGTYLSTCIESHYQKYGEASKIYYHSSSLANSAGDGSYRYSGGDYYLTSKASSYDSVYEYETTTNAVIKLHNEKGSSYSYIGRNCIDETCYYYLDYDNAKTQYKTLYEAQKAAVSAGYIKENVNNYVCFGSTASTCPEDNLYRIIGSFDGYVKLIKADYAKSSLLGTNGDFKETITIPASITSYKGPQTTLSYYYWNASTANGGTATNDWRSSRLNTINLNTNFLNNIGSTWSNKIYQSTWNITGYSSGLFNNTAKEAYDIESNRTSSSKFALAKIGLQNESEYGFAALPEYWTTKLYGYNNNDIKNNNWMFLGEWEWSIIPNYNGSSTYVGLLYSTGGYGYGNITDGHPVRPTFSLNYNVTYLSGSGSRNDPIRIN